MRYLLFLPVIFAMSILSCSKDKDTDAGTIPEDIYGEYAYELLGDPVEGSPDQLFTAVFTRKTKDAGAFEWSWQVNDEGGVYFVVAAAKGEFTILGKVIRFEEEFLGYQWDEVNEVILDSIVWIDNTDPKWEEFDPLLDVEFEIVTGGIIFINDENGDGVITEEERVFYERS